MTSSAQKSHVLKRQSVQARAVVVQFPGPPLARASSDDGTARVARRRQMVGSAPVRYVGENTPIPHQRDI